VDILAELAKAAQTPRINTHKVRIIFPHKALLVFLGCIVFFSFLRQFEVSATSRAGAGT
jgi:hypothetical protein